MFLTLLNGTLNIKRFRDAQNAFAVLTWSFLVVPTVFRSIPEELKR